MFFTMVNDLFEKKSSDERLRVPLNKTKNLSKNRNALKFVVGVWEPVEFEFGNEKLLQCRIDGLQDNFHEI